MKKALLINDMAGYGKVALSAMIPVLSHMETEVFNLPTALVSNTLDYGKFAILDTTNYMRQTLTTWDELGFSFDAIAAGFIVSAEQVQLIVDYCRKQHEKGVWVFTDPIMGDDGHLYNGVTPQTIENMRHLVAVSDIIVPNQTEAAYLASNNCAAKDMTRAETEGLLDHLRNLGAKSVIVTSASVEGQKQVCGYDKNTDEYFFLPFEESPIRFPGTGDIFAALVFGKMLGGENLKTATQAAMRTVEKIIRLNKDNADKYKGIPIEMYLKTIDEE